MYKGLMYKLGQHLRFWYLSHNEQMSLTSHHAGVSSKARNPNFGPSLICIYTSCVQAVKAKVNHLSSKPLLLTNAISTEISCIGPYRPCHKKI